MAENPQDNQQVTGAARTSRLLLALLIIAVFGAATVAILTFRAADSGSSASGGSALGKELPQLLYFYADW